MKKKSFQFSTRALFMATVAVAVWISGFTCLFHMFQEIFAIRRSSFFLTTTTILAMTMASFSLAMVVYGTLLMLAFCGGGRAEQYYRGKLKIWLRFVLFGTISIAPWLVVLAFRRLTES